MEWDDIVYLSLLFGSIGFGKVLRSIDCPDTKKNVATLVGVIIVFIVSGLHIIHPLVFVGINAIIINFLDKKIIHIVSFGFSFTYLIFFRTTIYFGIPYAPAHTNLVLMILTFKMVGLAFEVHDSYKAKKDGKNQTKAPEKRHIEPPSFIEIFHYGLCYLGVLTGPYYTYRMYCDLFTTPFWKYVPCDSITLKRFIYLPLYAVIFIAFTYFFPLSYAEKDEFYTETSVWFRIWYTWPLFVQFRMRMYIGMRLSECVLTMAGLGAYPEICESKPTAGPTKHVTEIDKLATDCDKAKLVKYDLIAAYNIEPYDCEFDPTVRGSMKAWNISVQYWLAAYVYLRFPIKAYRTLVTFFISALWHGVYAGYYCTICSVPLYLPIEDVYRRKLRDINLSPWMSKIGRFLAAQWRLYLMSYWAVTFRLLTFEASIKYWSSIYFITHIITFVMYGLSFVIFKKRKLPKPAQEGTSAKKDN